VEVVVMHANLSSHLGDTDSNFEIRPTSSAAEQRIF